MSLEAEASEAPAKPRRYSGFTLIELVVAVAIAAFLASIAYPSYVRSVNKSKTAQAIADIITIELALERYDTQNNGFPADLPSVGINTLDPWGNPYQYLNMTGAKVGQVRKDKSLHPLNTDYDLYSMGPDGKSVSPLTASSSKDDIVRANNGSFVGVAADF